MKIRIAIAVLAVAALIVGGMSAIKAASLHKSAAKTTVRYCYPNYSDVWWGTCTVNNVSTLCATLPYPYNNYNDTKYAFYCTFKAGQHCINYCTDEGCGYSEFDTTSDTPEFSKPCAPLGTGKTAPALVVNTDNTGKKQDCGCSKK